MRLLRFHLLGLLVVSLALASSLAAAPPVYKLTDLGLPNGYSESDAIAIANSGNIVAGNVIDGGGEPNACIWTNGTFILIPVPGGYVRCQAVSMNNYGEIVGNMFRLNGGIHAFAYYSGLTHDLGTIQSIGGVDQGSSYADDINDSDDVVGSGDIVTPYIGEDACTFSPIVDLGIKQGYISSEAYCINNSGQIVVGEDNGSGSQLFLFNGGTFVDLNIEGVPSLGGDVRAYTINESGQIIGQFVNSGNPFLCYSSNDTVIDLSPVLGDGATIYDINNSGIIVGGSGRAFLYQDGTRTYLDTLTITGGAGWRFQDARGINDSGQIVGTGYTPANAVHAYILTPATGGGGGGGGTPLTITTQPVSKSVNPGASVTFSVAASGAGTLKYQWYFNSTTKISGATKSSYTISAAASANAGAYDVVFSNATASVTSAKATLTVSVPAPVITTEPAASTTVKAGASVVFKIVAKKTSATLKYQWQRLPSGTSVWANLANKSPYSGVTTASLTVKPVAAKNSGDQFRCVVSDSGGATTSNPAKLLVQSAPAITFQPVNTSVAATQAASFVVVASGVPTPTYQWQRLPAGAGKWAQLANGPVYANVTTPALTLPSTTLVMSGDQFECVLKNSLGSVTSKTATLTVTPLPAAISSSPSNQTITFGNNTTFSVTAIGVPAPTLQWQISTDGGSTWVNLTANATFSGVTNATLSLANVTAALDGDQFRCLATNAAGSTPSNPATLNLFLPPIITTQPANVTVYSTVTSADGYNYTVVASGNPAPTYQWQLSTDGGNTWNNLSDNSTYSGSLTSVLNLLSATSTLNGYQYRCVITNVLNSVTSAAATYTYVMDSEGPGTPPRRIFDPL